MSHWPKAHVDTSNRAWIVISWNPGEGIVNDSARPWNVYMELAVRDVRTLRSDALVVRTLPGINNFITDRDRTLVLHTEANILSVQPGFIVGPVAVVILDRRALPEGIEYDIETRVRAVENPTGSSPGDVGRVVDNGEHNAKDILTVGWV